MPEDISEICVACQLAFNRFPQRSPKHIGVVLTYMRVVGQVDVELYARSGGLGVGPAAAPEAWPACRLRESALENVSFRSRACAFTSVIHLNSSHQLLACVWDGCGVPVEPFGTM